MLSLKTVSLLIMLLAYVNPLTAQVSYQLSEEEIVYSFETVNGKSIAVCKNKKTALLVFRMGTKDKMELQFPAEANENEKVFSYSHYMRGGGESNEAIDLNYLYFVYRGIKYVVYETSYAKENKVNSGIKMIDISTAKVTDLKGLEKTKRGSLIALRDSITVVEGDEMFD